MAVLDSPRNQYLGINAHLHSLLQEEGSWGGFHALHITDIYKELNKLLLPMGYVAGLEESLQIRRLGDPPRTPRSDLLVFDADPIRPYQPQPTATPSVQTIELTELLLEPLSEKPYRAIAIYEFVPTTFRPGPPVVWIELLSPTNKGSSEDAAAYRAKRMDLLVSELVFVELDYLHETPPTFDSIPSYAPSRGQRRHPDAHPYCIAVLDPRPRLEQGVAQVAQFDVDQPIPTMNIPLNGDDLLKFDFGVPYRATFEEGFYWRGVDYRQLPRNFERYSPADQRRIAARTLAVLEADRAGVKLATGPFEVKDLGLEEALVAIGARE